MQGHDIIDDIEETLSLSNFHMEDENHSSFSSSSSSDQDFLGFFSEEWSRDTSLVNIPENIVFCGKVVSFGQPIRKPGTKRQTNPLFRSNSDSFRYMGLKTTPRPSTLRSKSLPKDSTKSFPCKSRFMVFMFGSRSSKFPTKVDMSDIKSRKLRQQRATADRDNEANGGRKSGNKGWWRVVDVLGCGGGYERDTVGVI
ncbi:hypothetical protein CTI12_AA394960 [Artemisia annua]|uniref:Uncharacterized protein n=1 Tax=Artemisia annua TaxID=35608 RepID=A0A2U1MDD2_ARTAN|nr:hypothetical protein CTI12_AA394960 [Artemisia annua]